MACFSAASMEKEQVRVNIRKDRGVTLQGRETQKYSTQVFGKIDSVN